MDELSSLLGRNGFLPHGYCFTWSPGLLWSMVSADAIVALSYFSIPVALVYFIRRRADIHFKGVAWLFIAFIFACGLTHVMDIWTIWNPDYTLHAATKVVTAGISMITAAALWPLMPQALNIPSVARLRDVIHSLEAEIAKRRSAEEQLAEIQQSLSVTLSSIGAGFLVTDREGRVARMNSVAERVLGWTEAQAQGQSYWKVVQREGRTLEEEQRNPVDWVLDQGLNVDTARHMTVLTRAGRRVALEVKVAPTYADDGSVRGMAVVFRDLTEQMRTEAENSRLAAIVESSNDAVIATTLDGRITNWNHGAEVLFGYSASAATGQPVQMLLPPGREAEDMRAITELAHGQKVPAFDTVRQARDGTLRDVSVSISPIRDGRGRIVGASKIVRDVSAQRRAEAQAQRLEAENRQIQEANRLKNQFLANMSHELRTPLNSIIGFADLLHSGAVPVDSDKHREFLGHIGVSGRHLLQLINDVLDLSKVESGRMEFFPEPMSLPQVVKEVQDVLQPTLQAKQIRFVAETDPAVAELQLDPARLKQVLYNYLSNAIKFTPEGGRVTLRAAPEGEGRLRIEVEDTGIGIAANDLPRLFNEFQQLDSGYGKRHQGTGLGLALTQRLVQAQGGSVGVRSTLGEGSVFHLVLDRVHTVEATDSMGSPEVTA